MGLRSAGASFANLNATRYYCPDVVATWVFEGFDDLGG
jgi:hypothetical protein